MVCNDRKYFYTNYWWLACFYPITTSDFTRNKPKCVHPCSSDREWTISLVKDVAFEFPASDNWYVFTCKQKEGGRRGRLTRQCRSIPIPDGGIFALLMTYVQVFATFRADICGAHYAAHSVRAYVMDFGRGQMLGAWSAACLCRPPHWRAGARVVWRGDQGEVPSPFQQNLHERGEGAKQSHWHWRGQVTDFCSGIGDKSTTCSMIHGMVIQSHPDRISLTRILPKSN